MDNQQSFLNLLESIDSALLFIGTKEFTNLVEVALVRCVLASNDKESLTDCAPLDRKDIEALDEVKEVAKKISDKLVMNNLMSFDKSKRLEILADMVNSALEMCD